MESSLGKLTVLKPFIIQRKQNSIIISWNECSTIEVDNTKLVYQLQMKNELFAWITVYSGFSSECEIRNLIPGPEVIYEFRLMAYYIQNGKKIVNSESDWSEIVRSTAGNLPPTVVHLNRAILYGDVGGVEDILKVRPYIIDAEDENGYTPLTLTVLNKNVTITQVLLRYGADVDSTTVATSKTTLMYAMLYSCIDIATHLLGNGADINSRDINNCTPLHYATDSNIVANVQFALENGANVNAMDRAGWTPLLRTIALNGTVSIIELLLENGSTLDIRDINGMDFVQHATLNDREDILNVCGNYK